MVPVVKTMGTIFDIINKNVSTKCIQKISGRIALCLRRNFMN